MNIEQNYINVLRSHVRAYFEATDGSVAKRSAAAALKDYGYSPEEARQLVNNGDEEDV
jgi:hypothetical protein